METTKKIKMAISKVLEEGGSFPWLTDLCSMTNLSRQTISKHLREFELGEHQKEEFQLLNPLFIELLSVLHKKGMEGDIAAIKLLAETLEKRGV